MITPMTMLIMAPASRCVPLEACAEALCKVVGLDAECPGSVTVTALTWEGSDLGMSVNAMTMLISDQAYPEVVAFGNTAVVVDDDGPGL